MPSPEKTVLLSSKDGQKFRILNVTADDELIAVVTDSLPTDSGSNHKLRLQARQGFKPSQSATTSGRVRIYTNHAGVPVVELPWYVFIGALRQSKPTSPDVNPKGSVEWDRFLVCSLRQSFVSHLQFLAMPRLADLANVPTRLAVPMDVSLTRAAQGDRRFPWRSIPAASATPVLAVAPW